MCVIVLHRRIDYKLTTLLILSLLHIHCSLCVCVCVCVCVSFIHCRKCVLIVHWNLVSEWLLKWANSPRQVCMPHTHTYIHTHTHTHTHARVHAYTDTATAHPGTHILDTFLDMDEYFTVPCSVEHLLSIQIVTSTVLFGVVIIMPNFGAKPVNIHFIQALKRFSDYNVTTLHGMWWTKVVGGRV